ncbi:DNA-binding response regulator [Nocardia amikacinitolerans]|uniref:DNA-binding response regulator n=1 Tax=Nocardia amikacinitolerans TaxID=756689 RepID=UPI0036773349
MTSETDQTKQPDAWRIGVVEDHTDLVMTMLERVLEPYSDMLVAAGAPTVAELLAQTTEIDLVVLDLYDLPDDSTPRENIEALAKAGVTKVLVYTHGSRRPALVREAMHAGALAVIRKSESKAVLVEALRTVVTGEPFGSMEAESAVDEDIKFLDTLTPTEKKVLRRYASGERAQDVAAALGIKTSTVQSHLKRIRLKYQLAGRPTPYKHDFVAQIGRTGLVEDI